MKTQMTEKNKVFENYKLDFLTDRRLKNYRRSIATTDTSKKEKWLFRFSDLLNSIIEIDKKRQKANLFFQTGRNLFVKDVKKMSATNFIEHYILIYVNIIFVVTKSVLYTAEEIN